MLYLVFTNDKMMALSLHRDDDKKKEALLNIGQLFSVHADGPELEFIASHFQNLPLHVARQSQIWFGDHAKFIAGNW